MDAISSSKPTGVQCLYVFGRFTKLKSDWLAVKQLCKDAGIHGLKLIVLYELRVQRGSFKEGWKSSSLCLA